MEKFQSIIFMFKLIYVDSGELQSQPQQTSTGKPTLGSEISLFNNDDAGDPVRTGQSPTNIEVTPVQVQLLMIAVTD